MATKVVDMSLYEKEREDRIRENKRKLEEMGVLDAAGDLRKSRPMFSTPVRKPHQSRNRSSAETVEVRKSARMANRPTPSYREMDETLEEMESKERKRQATKSGRSRGFVSYCKRGVLREGDIGPFSRPVFGVNPCFIRPIKPSHVSGCFWLGLPANFCNEHMPDTIEIFLMSVAGKDCIYETKYNIPGQEFVWESKYLPHKSGLSGGWRGFSLDLQLAEGDCLLFELVTERHFFVHIFRRMDYGSASKAEDAAYAMLDGFEQDSLPPLLIEANAPSPTGADLECRVEGEVGSAQTRSAQLRCDTDGNNDDVKDESADGTDKNMDFDEDEEEVPAPKLVRTPDEESNPVDVSPSRLKLVRLKDVYKVKKAHVISVHANEKKVQLV